MSCCNDVRRITVWDLFDQDCLDSEEVNERLDRLCKVGTQIG